MKTKASPPIPLQRYLQNCGLGSRRNLRQRIHNGLYQVNGEVITNPAHPVHPLRDKVQEGQRPLQYRPQALVYYAFNKPTGVITSLKDPQGRPCVGDFLRRFPERVYPVGRLDWDSEGLIILTNDGALTQRILAARNHVPKTYQVKIKGILEEETRRRVLEKGLVVDGRRTRILQLDPQRTTHGNNTWILITVMEGRNHLVRHIFQYLGHPVDRLRRVSVANFRLGRLPLGQIRPLRPEEIRQFWQEYPEEGSVHPPPAPRPPRPARPTSRRQHPAEEREPGSRERRTGPKSPLGQGGRTPSRTNREGGKRTPGKGRSR